MHGISMDHAWDRMGPQYGRERAQIIFPFLCQSSSYYVISKSSTKNDQNYYKSLEVFTSHFVHTFEVWKFLSFEEKLSK